MQGRGESIEGDMRQKTAQTKRRNAKKKAIKTESQRGKGSKERGLHLKGRNLVSAGFKKRRGGNHSEGDVFRIGEGGLDQNNSWG